MLSEHGSISLLYKMFVSPPTNLSHQLARERDLGEEIDEEDWTVWTFHINEGVMNTALWEAGYKVYSRGYLVLEQFLKMYTPDAFLCAFEDVPR